MPANDVNNVLEIKGKVNTALCYAKVVEEEAIEQIRRMCEVFNYRVMDLKRVRIMNIRLGNLKEGSYRKVTEQEWRELEELIKDSSNETVIPEMGL